MKKTFPFLLKFAIVLLFSILCGLLLLIITYSLPTSLIHEHMSSSTETLINEGAYPDSYRWCQSELDNFTDAIMLSEAAYSSDESALQKALLSERYILYNDWTNLMTYTEGRMVEKVDSYARYWHGYLITLKPLLMITDYNGIRIINLIVQSLLVLLVCILLYRKGLTRYIVPYLICICIISPLVIAKSLQMSTCYYIFNLGCVAVVLLKGHSDHSRYLYLFLILGIVTAYMDFLTYPLATFGMPAVFFLISTDMEDNRRIIFLLINFLICWGIGYAGMWASKWILADIITGASVLSNAASEAGIWMDEAKQNYTILYTWYRNIRSFVLNPAFIIAFVLVIVLFIVFIKRFSMKHLFSKAILSSMLPFIMIAILPFIWYAVMMAHSYVHDFFTSKALITTTFAIICALTKSLFSKNMLSINN